MGAAARTSGLRAYFFFYFFRLLMTLCVLPLLVSFVMNSFISAMGKQEELKKMKLEEQEEERKYQEALEMNFHDDIGISEEKQALERVNRTLGQSFSSTEGEENPTVERDTLHAMRRSAYDKYEESLHFRSPSQDGSEDDSVDTNDHKSPSIMSLLTMVMPNIHFEASERHAHDSKYSKRTTPSMLHVWGGADQIPASGGPAMESTRQHSSNSLKKLPRINSGKEVDVSRMPSRPTNASSDTSVEITEAKAKSKE